MSGGDSQPRTEGASLPEVRGAQNLPPGDPPWSEVSVLLCTDGLVNDS